MKIAKNNDYFVRITEKMIVLLSDLLSLDLEYYRVYY